MGFYKVETTSNFAFGSLGPQNLTVVDQGSSVFRLTVSSDRWPRGSDSLADLTPGPFGGTPSRAALVVGPRGELTFSWDETPLLRPAARGGLGVCGTKWVAAFAYDPDDRFYGMGQKHLGLELSRRRTKFWNTDEFGELPFSVVEPGEADPSYSSFPVLIVRHGSLWAAVVADNPHCVFMNTGAPEAIFQPGAGPFVPELFVGSRDGAPDLWFLADETPSGLVRKVLTLQGKPDLPPLWALGHHQCRWGYRSYDDLRAVADRYEELGIPNDGLWLDIDYMDGFRVFTVDEGNFSNVTAQLKALADRGYRVVPILDPGFRQDSGYGVYSEAKAAGLLCQNPEGQDFVGYVWPGYTVFPDFSLTEAREFWAKKVEQFTRLGFGGYWIDMNDPATGSVPHDDMLFGRGKLPHSAFHNQYALGMAMATKEGLEAARPGERPFVLSRSAFLSASRHTAQWTGDNVSNRHHMKGAIAMSLNLSVSGMPFNGPDIPGFAKDAESSLMRCWYKLGFLFPFFRNHNVQGAADQEPWSRDPETTGIVRDYIRLRYKLLPYLYRQFAALEESGDPVLRPVWYHDPSPEFEGTDDVFFVGPSVLQGPFTAPDDETRRVTLPRHPGGRLWFDVEHREFTPAGSVCVHRQTPRTTPVYLACPAVIPLQRGIRTDNRNDLARIDLLLVLGQGQPAAGDHLFDDGITLGWKSGARSRFAFGAELAASKVAVRVTQAVRGFGGLSVRFLVLSPQLPSQLEFLGETRPLVPEILTLAGTDLTVAASQEFDL